MCAFFLCIRPTTYQNREEEEKIIQTVIRKERGIGSREKRLIDHWLKGERRTGKILIIFFLCVITKT